MLEWVLLNAYHRRGLRILRTVAILDDGTKRLKNVGGLIVVLTFIAWLAESGGLSEGHMQSDRSAQANQREAGESVLRKWKGID